MEIRLILLLFSVLILIVCPALGTGQTESRLPQTEEAIPKDRKQERQEKRAEKKQERQQNKDTRTEERQQRHEKRQENRVLEKELRQQERELEKQERTNKRDLDSTNLSKSKQAVIRNEEASVSESTNVGSPTNTSPQSNDTNPDQVIALIKLTAIGLGFFLLLKIIRKIFRRIKLNIYSIYKIRCHKCGKWGAMQNITTENLGTYQRSETRFFDTKDRHGNLTGSQEGVIPLSYRDSRVSRKCKFCGYQDSVVISERL